MTHLGFDLDTKSMTVSCPQDKITRLQTLCSKAMESSKITVHDCERMLGQMESVRPVTPHAALRYRALQKQLLRVKSAWPKDVRRSGQVINLSPKSLQSLAWWVSPSGFQGNSSSPIWELPPTVEVWTDANLEMGGAHNTRGQFIQRCQSDSELCNNPHISFLETRAAKEAVSSLLQKDDRDQLYIDNTTACSCI